MKRHLLLVDGDPRSRRLLEVSLRKAGYTVTPAEDGEEALELARDAAPDLILADTVLPRLDGFGLVAALRRDPSLANVPLVFLSSDTSLTSKVRGLELGIEYLTKPIYIREVLTRVSLEIERASRKVIELKTDATTRFSGTLADMALVDLLQTIDVSRKSGVLRVSSTAGDGHLWFRDGQVVDAETKNLTGALAIYRILTWNEGSFELTFGRVDRKGVLDMSTQALLLEGMRRIDEWGRTTEQLPPLDATLEVNEDALLKQLAVLPDDTNQLLKLCDGEHTLREILERTGGDDLEVLGRLAQLLFEGVIAEGAARRAGSVAVPVVEGALARSADTGGNNALGGTPPRVDVHTTGTLRPPVSEPAARVADALDAAGEVPSSNTLRMQFTVKNVQTLLGGLAPAKAPESSRASDNVIRFPSKDARASERPPSGPEPEPARRSTPPDANAERTSERPPSLRPGGIPVESLPENVEEKEFFDSDPPAHVVGDAWDDVHVPGPPVGDSRSVVNGLIATVVALGVLGFFIYYGSSIMRTREDSSATRTTREVALPGPDPASLGEPAAPAPPPVAEPVTAPAETAAATASDPASEPEVDAVPVEADPVAPKEPTPESEPAAKTESASMLSARALRLLNAGKNTEAAELATRATELDATDSRAWITLGASLQAQGKPSEAREAYSRCVSEGKGRYVRDCRLMLH